MISGEKGREREREKEKTTPDGARGGEIHARSDERSGFPRDGAKGKA